MTLKDYKASRGLTLGELADQLGFPISTINGWIIGRRKPEPEHVPAIVLATGGAVSAADLRPDLAALFATSDIEKELT